MDLTHIGAAQAIGGLLVTLGTLIALLAAAGKFVFVPRIYDMITTVVDRKLEEREKAAAPLIEAKKTAIEELGTRIGLIEERMTENEKAAAETKAAVERIEEATKRQSKTLEAIAEGIGEIKEGFVEQRVKVQRAEEDIKELQTGPRRRAR